MEDKWKRIPSLDFPKVIISPWYTNTDVYFFAFHSVWKSQKKYHLTLRAKRATFTFWVDKSWLKNAQNGPFWRLFEDLKLAVKQTYQTNQFWKEKNRWKIPKFQNSNASFCVIFKQCASVDIMSGEVLLWIWKNYLQADHQNWRFHFGCCCCGF